MDNFFVNAKFCSVSFKLSMRSCEKTVVNRKSDPFVFNFQKRKCNESMRFGDR